MTQKTNIDNIEALPVKNDMSQINEYAKLGYSPQRIASMLNLSGKAKIQFVCRINSPGDTYNIAYKKGEADGEYTIDLELCNKAEKGEIEAIELLDSRKNNRNLKDLKMKLFGV